MTVKKRSERALVTALPAEPVEADSVAINKEEAQRVLAWFGQAASVAPGDFELAARIRRAFE